MVTTGENTDFYILTLQLFPCTIYLGKIPVPHNHMRDPVGGGGGSGPPPLEFWQKCGYRVREWDRFHIEQHLCSTQY